MKDSYEKVLNVFFDNPTGRFYIREIARLTQLSPNTILNITKHLEKQEFIKKEKKKHIVELYADINERFKQLKRVVNFRRILESGLIEFLNDKFSPEAICVMGSYSRGRDIKDSDIDIVVISKKDYSSVSLINFEKKLNRKIHLIVTYYNKISKEFYINLINGIVLCGYINKK